jgi:hypothetical protein
MIAEIGQEKFNQMQLQDNIIEQGKRIALWPGIILFARITAKITRYPGYIYSESHAAVFSKSTFVHRKSSDPSWP